MPKTAISVTLSEDNVLWLRGRSAALKRRSLSDTLDEIVTTARAGGRDASSMRSVIGTVDIAADDPGLDRADASIGSLFEASVGRAWLVRDAPAPSGARRRTRRG